MFRKLIGTDAMYSVLAQQVFDAMLMSEEISVETRGYKDPFKGIPQAVDVEGFSIETVGGAVNFVYDEVKSVSRMVTAWRARE